VLAVGPKAIPGMAAGEVGGTERVMARPADGRQSVAGEPRQVISRFAASTADPDSFTTCAVPRMSRPMTTHRIPPTYWHSGFSHRCPKTPALHFGRHRVAPAHQDDAQPVPRCACPAITAASDTRVHNRRSTSARTSASTGTPALWPNHATRVQPARPAAHPTRPF
jgi:hypothetical protein